MRIFTITLAAVLLVGLASAHGETITFEDGTSNPFVLTGDAAVGTPGDSSDKSMVMALGDPNDYAVWTTGITSDTINLTARVRPD
jgi:hypothetical protein